MPETLLRRALRRAPVERTPVWLMRQAGRYLPEYRELRAKAGDFLTLASTPELAAAVTLQPLERFELDAAIVFSDILIIPHAMGLGLHFVQGEGPRFAKTVRDFDTVQRLPIPDTANDISYLPETLERVREKLSPEKSLIGFAGSPWTVATYMVEGGSSRTFEQTKKLLYREPATLHALLGKLADATTGYLLAQVKAGADVVMVFDTWGGALTTGAYKAFSLDYMQRIVDGVGEPAAQRPRRERRTGGDGDGQQPPPRDAARRRLIAHWADRDRLVGPFVHADIPYLRTAG